MPYVALPNGRALPVEVSAETPLPAGLTGEVTLFSTGHVPMTLDLDQASAITVHPAPLERTNPTIVATRIAGQLAPAVADVQVRWHAPGLQAYVGTTTDAAGGFAFDVPLSETQAGLIAAVEPGGASRVALVRTTLTPGTPLVLPELTLVAPLPPSAPFRLLGSSVEDPLPDPLPTPPTGMTHAGATLRVVETAPTGRWEVTLLAVDGSTLPDYDLPGFALAHGHRFTTADRRQWSEASGAPGALPAILTAPRLPASPALAAGQRLTWDAVPGATLYTLRLTDRFIPDPPLWEGATVRTAVTIPTSVALGDRALELRLDAWDAPDVTMYSVAGLRALRLPVGLPVVKGRHSWAIATP